MTYGVTSTGFVMPTLPEIIDDMTTTAKELFGSNVDTEVWSSLGMFIRTIAADNLLVWQGQRDLYYVPYLDFAYGQNLDDLLAPFAFNRRIAERATGYAAFTGAVGTSITDSTVIKTLGDSSISFKTVDSLTITEMVTNGEFVTGTTSWTAENSATIAVASYTLDFTSGGTHEVIVGDTLTGAISGATAVVSAIILSGGTWAGGDAAGTFYFSSQVGTFEAENLDDGTDADVCTIATDSTSIVDSDNCLVVICGAHDDPYAEQQITVNDLYFYDLSVLVKAGTEATYNVDVYDVTNSAYIYQSGDLEETAGDWSTTVTQRIEIPDHCTTIAVRLKQKATSGAGTTLLFDTASLLFVTTPIIAVDAALMGNVPADNIIVLESPISGIVSVTNPNATIGGRDKELDAVYRARYKLSTAVVGNATLNAIVSKILAITNVSSASIEENDTAIDYSNRLLNHDFDSDVSHWYAVNGTIDFDGTAGIGGAGCLKVTGDGVNNDPYGYQIVPVEPSEVYTLTVYIKEGTEQDYIISVRDLDNASAAIGADCTGTETAGDWSTSCVKSSFTIPAGCYSIEVRVGQSASAVTNTIFFDSSSLHLDPAGLPPHSVRVSAEGGTDNEVAQALLDSVAGGIETFGDESGTGELDANGQVFTRYFTRPNQILLTIAATITSDSTYVGDTAVETAIITYIGGTDDDGVLHDGLPVGADVIFYEVASAIMSVTGVTNVSGLTLNGGTTDVSIASDEVAYATTASVTIS